MMKPRLLFAVFFAAALLCAAQTKFPDTPAALQFSAWLDAFNSGDRAVLLAYLQKNNPSHAADIDQEFGFRTQTGGFDFKKVEESAPTRLTGVVKERGSDQFARFTIEVEPAEPHRIKELDLRAIPLPAEFPMPRLSQDAALAALRVEAEKPLQPIVFPAPSSSPRTVSPSSPRPTAWPTAKRKSPTNSTLA